MFAPNTGGHRQRYNTHTSKDSVSISPGLSELSRCFRGPPRAVAVSRTLTRTARAGLSAHSYPSWFVKSALNSEFEVFPLKYVVESINKFIIKLYPSIKKLHILSWLSRSLSTQRQIFVLCPFSTRCCETFSLNLKKTQNTCIFHWWLE